MQLSAINSYSVMVRFIELQVYTSLKYTSCPLWEVSHTSDCMGLKKMYNPVLGNNFVFSSPVKMIPDKVLLSTVSTRDQAESIFHIQAEIGSLQRTSPSITEGESRRGPRRNPGPFFISRQCCDFTLSAVISLYSFT